MSALPVAIVFQPNIHDVYGVRLAGVAMSDVHQLSIVQPHHVWETYEDITHDGDLIALFHHIVWDGLILEICIGGGREDGGMVAVSGPP